MLNSFKCGEFHFYIGSYKSAQLLHFYIGSYNLAPSYLIGTLLLRRVIYIDEKSGMKGSGMSLATLVELSLNAVAQYNPPSTTPLRAAKRWAPPDRYVRAAQWCIS
jgi:hypothetical protein